MAGAVAVAGCIGGDDEGSNGEDGEESADGSADEDGFPVHDVPPYGNWVPDESYEADRGVIFTHINYAAVDTLENGGEDDEDAGEELSDDLPIMGLPLYALGVTPFTVFGIARYPFSGEVFPNEEASVSGIETETVTWADNVLVFTGEYDPTVFEEEFADDFTEAGQQEDFTIYDGEGESAELAFAASETTVVVPMEAREGEYVPQEALTDALDRNIEEMGRVLDTDDGAWLFETTGEASVVFGAWETPDLRERLDSADEDDEQPEEIEDNPVFDELESVINTLDFSFDEAGETERVDARFSALFPADSVPSEDEVREHVVGEEEVPHEIVIEDQRVHVTVSLDEEEEG